MYGGRPLEIGISRTFSLYIVLVFGFHARILTPILRFLLSEQQQTMMGKQEAVFEHLTNLAVCVQNCTKLCEATELDSREARDAARRRLVGLWVHVEEARRDASSGTQSITTITSTTTSSGVDDDAQSVFTMSDFPAGDMEL